MADEHGELTISALSRWLVIGALVLAGIGCYLWLAPRTPALVLPAGTEAQ